MKEELASVQKLLDYVIEFLVKYSFQVLGAIIIFIIGVLIAKWLSNLVFKFCEKKNIDVTLSGFIANVTKIFVLVFVFIIVLGKFGISIAPFIAALGALVFGASIALQGPLSNYGAGLSIILSRPFVVGDTVTINNYNGIVEKIKLAVTELLTENGERISIPNKHIVGEILVNSFSNRVVEATIGISYGDDPQKAIDLIKKILAEFSQIEKEPEPQIGIKDFGDSSVNIEYRYWVATKEYFNTSYKVNIMIFKELTAENITIPFPQRDVNIIQS